MERCGAGPAGELLTRLACLNAYYAVVARRRMLRCRSLRCRTLRPHDSALYGTDRGRVEGGQMTDFRFPTGQPLNA